VLTNTAAHTHTSRWDQLQTLSTTNSSLLCQNRAQNYTILSKHQKCRKIIK